MIEGWIKYHRSFREHWLYKTGKPKTKREAWEDILLLVNYEPKKILIKGQLYECERGQSLFSLQTWAEEFNWSIQQVRTFFNLLEKDLMITVEGLQYTTRLTVCNYDIYQDNQQTDNTPTTDGQQTDNTPLTTTKEDKEDKEVKKIKKVKNKEFVSPSLDEVKIYFKENNYKEETAIKFFQSYSVADWVDSKGNKVKNWKQKAINVWFKDENKVNCIDKHYVPR